MLGQWKVRQLPVYLFFRKALCKTIDFDTFEVCRNISFSQSLLFFFIIHLTQSHWKLFWCQGTFQTSVNISFLVVYLIYNALWCSIFILCLLVSLVAVFRGCYVMLLLIPLEHCVMTLKTAATETSGEIAVRENLGLFSSTHNLLCKATKFYKSFQVWLPFCAHQSKIFWFGCIR